MTTKIPNAMLTNPGGVAVVDGVTSTDPTAAASANTARLLSIQATNAATAASNAATLAAGKLDAAAVGATVAPLVNNLVPAGNLPSFVDDVLEFANFAALPNPGESGKIYVTTSAETVGGTAYPANTQRRWSGSAYVVLVASPGTTDNVVEGSGNKYFTDARANTALAPTLANYAPARPPVSVPANTALTKADHANRDLELTGSGTPTLSGSFVKGDALFPFNATGASITYNFLTPMAGRKSTYAPNETASLRFDGMYWRSDDVDVTAAAPVLGTISGTTAADTSNLTYTAPSNYSLTGQIYWQRDGVDINGANSAIYAKTSADYGHNLSVRVPVGSLSYLTNTISVVAGANNSMTLKTNGTRSSVNFTTLPNMVNWARQTVSSPETGGLAYKTGGASITSAINDKVAGSTGGGYCVTSWSDGSGSTGTNNSDFCYRFTTNDASSAAYHEWTVDIPAGTFSIELLSTIRSGTTNKVRAYIDALSISSNEITPSPNLSGASSFIANVTLTSPQTVRLRVSTNEVQGGSGTGFDPLGLIVYTGTV